LGGDFADLSDKNDFMLLAWQHIPAQHQFGEDFIAVNGTYQSADHLNDIISQLRNLVRKATRFIPLSAIMELELITVRKLHEQGVSTADENRPLLTVHCPLFTIHYSLF
jgi:hypothetical protein